MKDRQRLLEKLVREGSLSAFEFHELASFGWDGEIELVMLSRADAAAMLDGFLSGSVLASALSKWADAIEGRDDIGYERGHEEELRELVFRLANPEISGEMIPASARDWLASLQAQSG